MLRLPGECWRVDPESEAVEVTDGGAVGLQLLLLLPLRQLPLPLKQPLQLRLQALVMVLLMVALVVSVAVLLQ